MLCERGWVFGDERGSSVKKDKLLCEERMLCKGRGGAL